MSIRSFKTDPEAAASGVWFDYGKNSDDTKIEVLLARQHKHNKNWLRAYTKSVEVYNEHVQKNGEDEAKNEELSLDVFVRTLLLGWRNFEPEDDGVKLDYSIEAARALLSRPEWHDLYVDMVRKTQDAGNYRAKALEAVAKN